MVLGSLVKNSIEFQKTDEADDENIIVLNQPKNKPLIDLANKWLNEEENLDVEDDELIEKIQEELANNKKEREALKVLIYVIYLCLLTSSETKRNHKESIN